MPQSNPFISLEKALKCKDINKWDFYEAVTGHDWCNKPLMAMGKIHPFKFTRQNRDQIYELVKKLRRYYEQTYEPEDNVRQYYCSQCDRIDKAYQTGKVRKQKAEIEGLLSAIVLD